MLVFWGALVNPWSLTAIGDAGLGKGSRKATLLGLIIFSLV